METHRRAIIQKLSIYNEPRGYFLSIYKVVFTNKNFWCLKKIPNRNKIHVNHILSQHHTPQDCLLDFATRWKYTVILDCVMVSILCWLHTMQKRIFFKFVNQFIWPCNFFPSLQPSLVSAGNLASCDTGFTHWNKIILNSLSSMSDLFCCVNGIFLWILLIIFIKR